jgi:hypothetical protein
MSCLIEIGACVRRKLTERPCLVKCNVVASSLSDALWGSIVPTANHKKMDYGFAPGRIQGRLKVCILRVGNHMTNGDGWCRCLGQC